MSEFDTNSQDVGDPGAGMQPARTLFLAFSAGY